MRFATLDQWLDWQGTLHPREIELGLERVAAVWRRLRPDGLGCPVISVAGTNGKGSSVALLEAILGAAGYRTASYTSPHLVRYNERIRLDGEPVDDARLCHAFDRVDRARGEIPLTYFEFGTLAALEIFADAAPEVALLEVGMGGRLDAVNVIDADVALITTIGLDHTAWLGDTLEQIAREKAGIMRPGRPAVCADPAPPASLPDHAKRQGVPLDLAGRDFGWRREAEGWSWWGGGSRRSALPLPALRGGYQLQNAAAVLMVLERLKERLPVDQQAVRAGLQQVRLQGRLQVLPGEPTVILDVAHNPQAAAALARDLDRMAHAGRTLALFGMLADKDVAAVATELAERIDRWYVATLDPSERGQEAEAVAAGLRQGGVPGRSIDCFGTPGEALLAALAAAAPEDRLVGFGSFHLVGALLERLTP